MKHRNFTRTDVATFVTKTFESFPRDTLTLTRTVEIREISLLVGTHSAIWHVAFTVIDVLQGKTMEHIGHTQLCCLVTQNLKYSTGRGEPKEYYLTFPSTIELPEGCSSTQEEDHYVRIHSKPS